MQYKLLLPEITLAAGILAIICADLVVARESRRQTAFGLGLLTLTIYIMAAAALGGVTEHAFAGHLLVDPWGSFFKLFFGVTGLLLLFLSYSYVGQRSLAPAEFVALLLGAYLGMSLMVSSEQLLTAYVGLELVSLTSYLLAAFLRQDPLSTEAGLKYFILGSVASATLLFGISFLYGYTGSLELATIAGSLSTGEGMVVIGSLLFLCGLLFKLAAVPFHVWAPDALQGAPTPITAFFSVGSKVAVLVLAGRFISHFSGVLAQEVHYYLLLVAIGSMTVGNLVALRQTNLKRLMAYSSIAHIGYLLVAYFLGTPEAYAALRVYVGVYAAANLGIFAIITWTESQNRGIEIDSFRGLGRVQPLFGLALGVFVFSLVGIPPTGGFMGKLLLFMASVQEAHYILAVIMVLNGVLSVVYYYRMLRSAFFEDSEWIAPITKNAALEAVVLVAVVVVMVTGVWPGWLQM